MTNDNKNIKRVFSKYFPHTISVTPTDSVVTFDNRFVHSCPICGCDTLSTPILAKASHCHKVCFDNAEDINELLAGERGDG